MSKRKVGGYAMSSEDEDDVPAPPPVKKAKPPGYMPPLLVAPPFKRATGLGAPRASPLAPSSRSSTPRVEPALSSLHNTTTSGHKPSASADRRTLLLTPRHTPNPTPRISDINKEQDTTSGMSSSEHEGGPVSPIDNIRSKGKERSLPDEPLASSSGGLLQASRSHAAFEREFDGLVVSVAECVSDKEEQAKEIEAMRAEVRQLREQIRELTESIQQLSQSFVTLKSQTELKGPPPAAGQVSSSSGAPTNSSASSIFTPNLDFDPRVDTLSFVPVSDSRVLASLVAVFRHRKAAEKPSIPESNQMKKLVRSSFLATLDNVSQTNEIKAPYFDRLSGKHDLFPAELADPVTKFVHAYPDWDAPLDSQIPFVVLVVERIRSTAPKNATDYSVTARTITEELLIEMIMDGPWKSCVSVWAQMKKDPAKIEEMRQAVRQNKRRVTKTGSRAEFREELPELAGEECDALFHEGMMSNEGSDADSEGDFLHVLRPDMRSSWLNSVYDCGSECLRRRRESLPGHAYQPRRRKIDTVKSVGIPDLQRGGKILKIPLFAISKKWRNENEKLIDDNPHRFDCDLEKPPNIKYFFLKYSRDDDSAALNASAIPAPIPEPEVNSAGGMVDDTRHEEEEEAEEQFTWGTEGLGGNGAEGGIGVTEVESEATVPIDPSLEHDDSGRPANATTAPKLKPRPKPLGRTGTVSTAADGAELTPSSTIRIKIPAFTQSIPPLPKPHPTQPTQTTQTTTMYTHPPVSEPDSPEYPPAIPHDGPQSPPPELRQDQTPTMRAEGVNSAQVKGGMLRKEGRGGKGGKGGKGRQGESQAASHAAGASTTAATTQEDGSVPAPPKRPRGRPRKNA